MILQLFTTGDQSKLSRQCKLKLISRCKGFAHELIFMRRKDTLLQLATYIILFLLSKLLLFKEKSIVLISCNPMINELHVC